MSPALASRFFTTEPAGVLKSRLLILPFYRRGNSHKVTRVVNGRSSSPSVSCVAWSSAPVCAWQASFFAPSPHPPSPPPPQCFSALLPLAPQSFWPSSFLYPSHTLSCLWKFPHLKQVQRKPGRMGVTAPTGTGQWAYSLGTGSSGSCWSPRGPHREDGRMAELEGLGEGRRVKYI